MRSLTRALGALFRAPKLDAACRTRLATWQRRARADLALAHRQARYVVVDVETTGLDLRRDAPIAIGAVGVCRGSIAFGDAFQVVLRQHAASLDANILIHGIGGETQLAGRDPTLAMLDFVEYAGASPLVAFRAEFDRPMLERAARDNLGVELRLPFIDLAFLLPALFRGTDCGSLDEWLAHFGGGVAARHDPLADAYATAQLLLIALAAADAVGMGNAQGLLAVQKAQRWLGRRT
ncbi:MAG TPA: 3'-5' exonuclease [Casimicrobiaceae bacterium]